MTLEEFIATCAEMGLDGVELTSYYFPATDRAYLNEIKKCCFAQGLHISGTAVGNNFCQPDPAKRREQVDLAKTWMDHAVVLGAPCIRVFAGPVPQGHTEPEAFDWTVACLKECAAYGEKLGVVVALENHGGITERCLQLCGGDDRVGVDDDDRLRAVRAELARDPLPHGRTRTSNLRIKPGGAPDSVTCSGRIAYPWPKSPSWPQAASSSQASCGS